MNAWFTRGGSGGLGYLRSLRGGFEVLEPRILLAVVTLDSAQVFQTMGQPVGPEGVRRGVWEATAWAGETSSPAFDNYIDDLLQTAVDELGIDRVRLEIRSGVENQRDFWSEWQDAGAPGAPDPAYVAWRAARYSTVNDNADPFVIDWAGFQFSELDNTIEKVILPLREKLRQAGKELYVNINYVSFNKQITDPAYDYHHTRDPEEYAELVLATYQHMQSQYGFVPDSWEVILEPENTGTGVSGGSTWPKWTAGYIAQSIVAAGQRLEAAGFQPRFVAPSNVNAGNTASWATTIAQYPGALDYFDEISYHLYSGNTIGNRQNIAAVAGQYGLNTAQLEKMGATHHDLYNDLVYGNNSSWATFTFRDYINVDESDPENPVVSIKPEARLLRQTMHYVRAGAIRIGAGSDDGNFAPVAFVNSDGGHVVVIKTATGGSISVDGLPAGIYGISYTTPSQYDVHLADVTIAAGQTVDASIPRDGVLTVFRKNPTGLVQFSVATQSVAEDGGRVTVTVTRTGGARGEVSVDYATADGTATEGEDYQSAAGTLTWADGDTADKTFTVAILDDTASEGIETIEVRLSNPTGGVVLGQPALSHLVISDNDVSLRAGLAGHWLMDDAAGPTATDSSGFGNDGTLIGGPVWTTGRRLGGLQLDGQDDYVDVPDAASLNPTSQLTLAAWVNSSDPSAAGMVVAKGDVGGQYHLRLFQDKLRFGLSTEGTISHYEPAYAFAADTWYHLAAVYDGATMRVYVNGNEVGPGQPMSGAITGTDGTGAAVGKRSGSTINYFPGTVDDLRIYGRALSPTEIGLLAADWSAWLDVDDSGTADALTDGVIILRYLFGFTGNALTGDAIGINPPAQRNDPAQIITYLDARRDTMLDVDANGQADALTDGILVLRHLFGFAGTSLIQDALAPNATRTDPGEIAAFLDQFRTGAAGMQPLSGAAGADAADPGMVPAAFASSTAPLLLATEGDTIRTADLAARRERPPWRSVLQPTIATRQYPPVDLAGGRYDPPAEAADVLFESEPGVAELPDLSDGLVSAPSRHAAERSSAADLVLGELDGVGSLMRTSPVPFRPLTGPAL